MYKWAVWVVDILGDGWTLCIHLFRPKFFYYWDLNIKSLLLNIFKTTFNHGKTRQIQVNLLSQKQLDNIFQIILNFVYIDNRHYIEKRRNPVKWTFFI